MRSTMSVMIDPEERLIYWNGRYADQGLIFGSDVNVFVDRHLSGLSPRRVLDLGCGQGRNALWLAGQGHAVTGVDLSDVAIGDARDLAATAGLDVDFIAADLVAGEPEPEAYDLVLLSYLHLEKEQRSVVHAMASGALAPGGMLFLVAHHVREVAAQEAGNETAQRARIGQAARALDAMADQAAVLPGERPPLGRQFVAG